mgnify:CR=1 FL=1
MALRNYELMMVLLPNMEDEGIEDLLGRVNKYVDENGGSVERQEKWGSLRKLAFPINDYTEGNYILSNLRLEPESIEQLEATLEVSENVLRHLVIRVDEFQQVPVTSVEPSVSATTPEASAPAEPEASAPAEPEASAPAEPEASAPAEPEASDEEASTDEPGQDSIGSETGESESGGADSNQQDSDSTEETDKEQ